MDDGRQNVMPGDSSVAGARARSARRVEPPADARHDPPFAVPGLVLLAAVAIIEGYQWLRIIPGGSLRPSGLLFAVAVVPATWWLTGHGIGRWMAPLRRVALAGAGAVPVLGLFVLAGHGTALHQCLGAASLLLAVAVLAIAAVSERGDHSASTR
jgi:hypothetical protein